MTRVKICGITNEADIDLSVSAGAWALGFVVEYPMDVPWNLDRKTAKQLMKKVPPFVSRVIVVGDDAGMVMELTGYLRPHVVQLHGNEPVSETAALASSIHKLGSQVIKPLRFFAETGECESRFDDPVDAAKQIEATGVDALVLDSVSRTKPAGTGKSIDWRIAQKIRNRAALPVILAGGLSAENVGRAVAEVKPYGVDVISGVEQPPGKKDPEKLKTFFCALK
ncbi:MAG: phosphoribosylanthranilate isomerase [Desulfobacteraceae bacterium]|nr:phosphoribosylanthranilate isomerase [Desulfobacteraceae bacterium]